MARDIQRCSAGTDTLASLPEGETAVLQACSGGRQLSTRLDHMGLRPGSRITKIGSMAGGGPITVECSGFRVALGRGIAQQILITRASEAAQGGPDADAS